MDNERMTQQYKNYEQIEEESNNNSFDQDLQSEEQFTHDSRVVKTVRSLKKQKRPESASTMQKLKTYKNNQENVYQSDQNYQNKTLLRQQKENSVCDMSGNEISPGKQPLIQPRLEIMPVNKISEDNLRYGRELQYKKSDSLNLEQFEKTQENKIQLVQITPQLTKQVEDQLIENNKEKIFDCVKTSNQIHEMLEQNGIDKVEIMDILFNDKLFRYQVASFLFKMKMLVKKRLEDFLITRIQIKIDEKKTDIKLLQKLTGLQQKLGSRMQYLQNLQRNVMDQEEFE